MLLSATHLGRRVTQPLKLCATEPSPHAVLADLRGLRGDSTILGTVLGPVCAIGIGGFIQRHLPLRDELAWRAARGQPLTAVERSALLAIDAVLDDLAPRSEALPREVQKVVREVLRTRRA